jgi:Styrene monooxygenase A putative substrate binding domain
VCRLFTGIAAQQPKAVTFGISPGAGELIEIPTVTFGGDATALLFDNRPGSDLEVLACTRYEANPRVLGPGIGHTAHPLSGYGTPGQRG